ncbi:sacsin like HSP90 chaperone domain, partial [Cryptosporidium canis]
NPLFLGNTSNEMTLEEITQMVGFWGEKVSFEAILPNAISRRLTLKSVDHNLVEDYIPRKLLTHYTEDDTIEIDELRDLIGVEDMSIEDGAKTQSKNSDELIKCKVKCFKESEATTIKLIWLNSLHESFLPCDFVLLRESYLAEGSSGSHGLRQHILALIEVKATKLPIWQFNISGSELQFAKKTGSKFKLLIIKDAGSSESQWSLVDDVESFIQENCTLVSGVFE